MLTAVVVAQGVFGVSAASAVLQPPPADGTRVRLTPGGSWVYEYPVGSGTWYFDGSVANLSGDVFAPGIAVTAPQTTIRYFLADGSTQTGQETFVLSAPMLSFVPPYGPAGYYTFFHHKLTKPTANTDLSKTTFAPPDPAPPAAPAYHYGIATAGAAFQQIGIGWGAIDSTTLGGGRTMLDFTVTNNTAENVGPVVPIINEWRIEPPGINFIVDTMEATPVDPAKAARLAPGESVVFHMRGIAATPAGQTRELGNTWAQAQPLADQTVYRFFNKRAGTHFYTVNEAEKAQVIATLSSILTYEGPAYGLASRKAAYDTPLYRFYNKRTGTHFYTASETEKSSVIANLSATYRFEGLAYYVSDTVSAAPVWRFYNLRKGSHFYTASLAEKNQVIATLAGTYRYEGPAFYLVP